MKEARDSLIVLEREYSRARIRLNTEVDRISRGIGQAKKVLQKTANPELKNLLDTLRAQYSEKMMTSDGPATTPTFSRQEKVTQIAEINERSVAFERGYKALIQKIQNAQLELDPDIRELKNQMEGFRGG